LVVEGSERDTTQDWLLPKGAAPPSLGELEGRIEEAISVARGSEVRSEAAQSAVVAIGESALDAARQARRAAGAAERAAASAAEAQQKVARVEARERLAPEADGGSVPFDESLRDFSRRADRVMRRLRDLGCDSRPAGVSNGRPAS
jgi:multidrug efflux pump subunit AcrA (membrane-fusion protein)